MTDFKILQKTPINLFSIVKVIYTVKTMQYAVGCFELLDTYPDLSCTHDFEQTLKGTVNNIYSGLDIQGEVFLTELEDNELLDGSIRPRDFAITIN
ncbi:MAG: hypothetical protein Unbinned4026contig1002_28 [Prokaryotic dsDNA virus sp.]|nr:MAG: hypothetical protein Unbinned4026contig1002_28 [Prokaryotic dsDNA virus sp.]|tara:strand:- start:427 stop:714 length:288 start_codon:yes stop_codon:yes gene_type:complete